MPEEYLHDDRLYREHGTDGRTSVLRPAERSRHTNAQLPQQAAAEFLTNHATQLGIQPEWLTGESLGVSDATALGDDDAIELLLATEKHQFDTTTVAFQQTWNGIPVWRRGTTVTMKTGPARVTGVQNTSFPSISVDRPTPAKIKASMTGKRGVVARALGLNDAPVLATDHAAIVRPSRSDAADDRVHIISNEVVVYRYDARRRLSDEAPRSDAPGPAMTTSPATVTTLPSRWPYPTWRASRTAPSDSRAS